MNVLDSLDAWVLAKHQWVADWAYTLFGISPYRIASWMFLLAGVCNILRTYIKYPSILESPLVWFLSCIILLFCGIYNDLASKSDRTWAKNELDAARPYISTDYSHRMVWLLWTILGLSMFLMEFLFINRNILSLLYLSTDHAVDVTITAGLYFMSCDRPTKKRRMEKLVLKYQTC